MYSTPNLTPGLRGHRYTYDPVTAGVIPCGVIVNNYLRVDRILYLGRIIGDLRYDYTLGAECSNTTGAATDWGGFGLAYSQTIRNIGDVINLTVDANILESSILTTNLAAFTFVGAHASDQNWQIMAAVNVPCYLVYGLAANIGGAGVPGNVQAQARNVRMYAEIAGYH